MCGKIRGSESLSRDRCTDECGKLCAKEFMGCYRMKKIRLKCAEPTRVNDSLDDRVLDGVGCKELDQLDNLDVELGILALVV